MKFNSPHLLWLFIPHVLLFSWEFVRQRSPLAATWPKITRAWTGVLGVSLEARYKIAGNRPRIWVWFGLALCVIALARPQWGEAKEQVFDQAREVLIAVDLSRSMLAQDVKPSRLDRSKLLINSLLGGLKGERVGLILFAGTAFLQSPFTPDYEVLHELLPALEPEYLPKGGTDYKALLETSIQAFGTSAADRYMIVLSDGESTTDNWRNLTKTLKKKGICVIALGVGTTKGALIPNGSGNFVKDGRGAVVLSKLRSSTLHELAQATGGVYADASVWVNLPKLLQQTVEAGKKGDFLEKNTTRLVERYQWFLAPGLLLLLISFWSEFPVLPRERAVSLGVRETPRKTPDPAETTISALLLALLVLASVQPVALASSSLQSPALPKQAGQTTEQVLSAPVRKKVVELAIKKDLSDRDFASLAKVTIAYGRSLTESKIEIPKKVLTDAIEAIDRGSALNPKTANWTRLRKELEEMLHKDKPPNQDDKQKQQQQSEKKEGQFKQNKDQNQFQQNGNQKKKQQDQQGKQFDQSGQQPQSSQLQPQEGDQHKGNQHNQNAFGDIKNQQQDKNPRQEPQPSATQKVGDENNENSSKPIDPNLTIPLQRLEQVRDQDSPAKLQQIMQSRSKKKPQKETKDW